MDDNSHETHTKKEGNTDPYRKERPGYYDGSLSRLHSTIAITFVLDHRVGETMSAASGVNEPERGKWK